MKNATIDDVAARAGVSIKTVSRVLNREPKVRESTRERVQEAMAHLNYRPNSPGRMLAGRKTYLLGLVYNENSSYINRIQNGVLNTCRGEHYDLLIHPCKYSEPTLLAEVRELATAPRVDGLLLTPPISDLQEVRELVDELGTPNVAISRGTVEHADWAVTTNDREVCAEMVRHLVRLGHRQIAFVQSHPAHIAMTNRSQGFLDGMHTAGLEEHPDFIVGGDNNFESGIDCGVKLLRGERRPTAVFCANDHMAAGVMKVAHESGLSIPGDVSIAGFDDVPLAHQIWPQLTTVRQPLQEMAELASALLIERLRGNEIEDMVRTVPAEIVVRHSTGPAPG